MHSVVIPNPGQVILAGSWTSKLLPWLKIIESFQFSICTTEEKLAMHINLLDSLVNYSCHTGRYWPKDGGSHCAWHQWTRFLLGAEMACTVFACVFKSSQNTVFLTLLLCKKVAWCYQRASQMGILACTDIFYYGCGNLSAGLASEPTAWRNTSAWS